MTSPTTTNNVLMANENVHQDEISSVSMNTIGVGQGQGLPTSIPSMPPQQHQQLLQQQQKVKQIFPDTVTVAPAATQTTNVRTPQLTLTQPGLLATHMTTIQQPPPLPAVTTQDILAKDAFYIPPNIILSDATPSGPRLASSIVSPANMTNFKRSRVLSSLVDQKKNARIAQARLGAGRRGISSISKLTTDRFMRLEVFPGVSPEKITRADGKFVIVPPGVQFYVFPVDKSNLPSGEQKVWAVVMGEALQVHWEQVRPYVNLENPLIYQVRVTATGKARWDPQKRGTRRKETDPMSSCLEAVFPKGDSVWIEDCIFLDISKKVIDNSNNINDNNNNINNNNNNINDNNVNDNNNNINDNNNVINTNKLNNNDININDNNTSTSSGLDESGLKNVNNGSRINTDINNINNGGISGSNEGENDLHNVRMSSDGEFPMFTQNNGVKDAGGDDRNAK